jgi:hypothetical protein
MVPNGAASQITMLDPATPVSQIGSSCAGGFLNGILGRKIVKIEFSLGNCFFFVPRSSFLQRVCLYPNTVD